MSTPNQREHILDEALSLMSEHGSAAMSMRRLAAACGLQVAAIYHYFPSKDALLASVFDERRYSSRLEEPIELDASGTVEDRLRAVFDVFWRGAIEEEPVLRLLLGEGLRSEPAAMSIGTSLLEVFHTGVRSLLGAHVPELYDPDTVSRVIVAQVFSGFIRHVFDPDVATETIAAQEFDVIRSMVALEVPAAGMQIGQVPLGAQRTPN